jgi:hypothetical protein
LGLIQTLFRNEITKNNYGSSIKHKDDHFAILDEKLKKLNFSETVQVRGNLHVYY